MKPRYPVPLLRRGRSLNDLEQTLELCNLRYLAPDCTYMFRPGMPGLTSSNRHYLYKRNAGWSNVGELSRGSAKNDNLGGTLTAIGVGTLGPNGRIEPQSTQLAVSPSDISAANWAVTDATKGATVTGPLGDVGQTVAFSASADARILDTTAFGTSGVYTISAWVKAAAATKIRLTMLDDGPATYNSADLDVTTAWTRISVQITATGNPVAAGLRNRVSGAATTIDVALINVVKEGWATSTLTAAATRASDSLLYDLSDLDALKTAGSIAWIGRNPWAIGDVTSTRGIMGVTNVNDVNDSLQIYCYNGQPRFSLYSGGVEYCYISGNVVAANTIHALGISWTANSAKFFQDGVQVGVTDTSVTVPTAINRIRIGQLNSGSGIFGTEHGALFVFDRVLTDAEWAGVLGATMRAAIFQGL